MLNAIAMDHAYSRPRLCKRSIEQKSDERHNNNTYKAEYMLARTDCTEAFIAATHEQRRKTMYMSNTACNTCYERHHYV